MREIRALSPGKLGHGCDADEVRAGLAMRPDFIAVDAGSTDPGAYYMGAGVPFFPTVTVHQDLAMLVEATRSADIPLIVGSVLTAGTDVLLAKGVEILAAVAREQGRKLRVAVIHAEQDRGALAAANAIRTMEPLGAPEGLTQADLDEAVAVVGQMGVEPIIRALEEDVDVVLAGRACDDALFAAMPIRDGFDPGLAMHMGKILECGSMSCLPGDLHGSLLGILRDDHFVLEPPSPHRSCVVRSIASHTLYEREDPFLQPGPGGLNDLSATVFEQLDDRRVRVSGSAWGAADEYLVKLEGARQVGYRTICIGGIRDPFLIAELDGLLAEAKRQTLQRFTGSTTKFTIIFRQYGRDGVMGTMEPRPEEVGHEIGLMIDVVADTQDLADAVCMYVRGTLQHAYYPGIVATAGNLAYPFSPFGVPCGPVYIFHIDHLMPTADPVAPFPIEVVTLG